MVRRRRRPKAAGLEIGRYLVRAQARQHLVEMAEALQASLLPPLSPMVPGLDIAVRYRAAGGDGQIGGDFFDVFPLPDGEWAILIGDVSGRGPRAAALIALARYTLRAAAIGAVAPSAVLNVLNDVVRRELDVSNGGDERFLTVAYMTVRPAENGYEVQLACGGHPYPLALRSDGSVEEIVCEGDLIGAFEVHECTDTPMLLREDDHLVLVPDGVTEAGRNGDECGEERLKRAIADAPAATASELADAIEGPVLDHLGSKRTGRRRHRRAPNRIPPVVENTNASIDVKSWPTSHPDARSRASTVGPGIGQRATTCGLTRCGCDRSSTNLRPHGSGASAPRGRMTAPGSAGPGLNKPTAGQQATRQSPTQLRRAARSQPAARRLGRVPSPQEVDR